MKNMKYGILKTSIPTTMKNYILRINDILYEKQDTQEDSKIITTFENLNVNELSFSYSKNSNNLLNNINLSIKKGQKIAIVGGSGEGKSNLPLFSETHLAEPVAL